MEGAGQRMVRRPMRVAGCLGERAEQVVWLGAGSVAVDPG